MTYEDTQESYRDPARRDDESAEIEELRRRIQALQADFASADRRLRIALRERPFVALATAVAAGFLLGRAIGRS